jgi:hypothetical protein
VSIGEVVNLVGTVVAIILIAHVVYVLFNADRFS